MSNFSDYVHYYDIFYSEKDYLKESMYVYELIKSNSNKFNRLLEMGCGTGKHANFFADYGFLVEAIDFSEDMINHARVNIKNDNIKFRHGDARNYKLVNKVDVIVSLFHVFSYMTSDEDVLAYINTAFENLENGGLLIFDYWYGPAVNAIGPSQRVRKIENQKSIIYRMADPKIYTSNSCVDVVIDIVDIDKESSRVKYVSEVHPMRHFTLNEIKLLVNGKFDVLNNFEWMKFTDADEKSWGAVCILRKK